MNPTEHKPGLPAEVREAIETAAINYVKKPSRGPLTLRQIAENMGDHFTAALAPLWPKPAPAPSDAEVAAAVERLTDHAFYERTTSPLSHADLRTVLAALADAQRDRERLANVQIALKEIVEARPTAYDTRDLLRACDIMGNTALRAIEEARR